MEGTSRKARFGTEIPSPGCGKAESHAGGDLAVPAGKGTDELDWAWAQQDSRTPHLQIAGRILQLLGPGLSHL